MAQIADANSACRLLQGGIDLGGEPLGADRFGVAISLRDLVHADQARAAVEVGRCDIEMASQALLAGIELVSAAIGQWTAPEIEDVVVEPQADVAADSRCCSDQR